MPKNGSQGITVLLAVLAWAVLATRSSAEQIPVQAFSVSNGLLPGAVWDITEDQDGFLWFSTSSGLSRFDGYTFRNYGVEDGLPVRSICCMLQRSNGERWVGTSEGLCRYEPGPPSSQQFTCFKNTAGKDSNVINSLVESTIKQMWVSTNGGLYRIDQKDGTVSFRAETLNSQLREIENLYPTSEGSIWVLGAGGIFRHLPAGDAEYYAIPGHPTSALKVGENELWVGTRFAGVYILRNAGGLGKFGNIHRFNKVGLPRSPVTSLAKSKSGQVWVGTRVGVAYYDGKTVRTYTRDNGLSDADIRALYVTRNGDLWVGSESGGVTHVRADGLVTLDERDGLTLLRSLLLSHKGEVIAIDGADRGRIRFNVWNGYRFTTFEPAFPPSITDFGWGATHIAVEDHLGEWWIATGQGLLRFPKPRRIEDLARTQPKAIYTVAEGLPTNNIYSVYEDRRGDIWVGCVSPGKAGMAHWIRSKERFENFQSSSELPEPHVPSAFAEDTSGNLWIGFYDGEVVRFRDRHFTRIASGGSPQRIVDALYDDGNGRIWGSSTSTGLFTITQLKSDQPSYSVFRTVSQVSRDASYLYLLEENSKKFYVGTTGVGVAESDRKTGSVHMITRADGLAGEYLQAILRDDSENIWMGMRLGISIYRPSSVQADPIPRVRIAGVAIGEKIIPVSDLGNMAVAVPELQPQENRIEIRVGSISQRSPVRFQYQLEGASSAWGQPQESPSITFPNLRPGHYKFKVRALNQDDVCSAQTAVVTFTILLPIWERWWFETLCGIFLVLVGYSIQKFRLNQLLAVERVRTRIASDLHDEIGANLSQIAIHSEVLRHKFGTQQLALSGPLESIAAMARDITASMSDIIWAIHPQRDHLHDLISRMRALALDLSSVRGVELTFEAAESVDNLSLGLEVRRELFLIFKETVNNALRHSKCTQLGITVSLTQRLLVILIEDNGRGFDASGIDAGHGISSMRARANKIAANLHVDSQYNRGTRVSIKLPLRVAQK